MAGSRKSSGSGYLSWAGCPHHLSLSRTALDIAVGQVQASPSWQLLLLPARVTSFFEVCSDTQITASVVSSAKTQEKQEGLAPGAPQAQRLGPSHPMAFPFSISPWLGAGQTSRGSWGMRKEQGLSPRKPRTHIQPHPRDPSTGRLPLVRGECHPGHHVSGGKRFSGAPCWLC